MEGKIPEPAVVLNALNVLTTPSTQTTSKDHDNLNTFEQLLKSGLDKFWSEIKHEKYEGVQKYFEDVKLPGKVANPFELRWSFTLCCLGMLELLCLSVNNTMEKFNKNHQQCRQQKELRPSQAPPLSPDTLSIGHQKTVLTAIQFIIALGISPHLKKGVGLPASKRTAVGEVLDLDADEAEIDTLEKNLRMIKCVRVLLKCSRIESLGTLILSRHLGDILASLLQLVHGEKPGPKLIGPCHSSDGSAVQDTADDHENRLKTGQDKTGQDKIIKDPQNIPTEKWTPATVADMAILNLQERNIEKENLEKNQNLEQNAVLSETKLHKKEDIVEPSENRSLDKENLDFCEESLNSLLENISQPLLVRELLILQGGPGRQPVQKGDGVNKLVKQVLVKAPAWLRKVCGQLLTGILMKPQGVHHVLHGMLGNAVVDTGGNLMADWRKFDAVAKVIASCPKMSSSTEEYYKLVGPQILSLLHHQDKTVARHFQRVASSTIMNMAGSYSELTQRYLITPLLNPLLRCCQENDHELSETQMILVDEQSLSLCIEDIHKVFVSGTEPSSSLSRYLIPVMQPLFLLYCVTKQGVSHLRSGCHEVLVTALKQNPSSVSLECLQCLVLDTIPTDVSEWSYLHPNVMFAAGSQGGIVAVTKPKEGYTMPDASKQDGIIDILKDLQKQGLTGDFFLFMLKELGNIIRGEITPSIHLSQRQSLLESDDSLVDERKINILNLLCSLCETIGPSCLKNTKQTLDFVEVTLDRAVQVIQAAGDDATAIFENETLTMAMGLLTSILTGGLQCSEEDRDHMKKMLPLLQSIGENHPDQEVQEMASDLRVAIATHGAVWSEKLSKHNMKKNENTGDKNIKEPSKQKKKKPLIEVINPDEEAKLKNETKQEEPNGTDQERLLSPYKQALKEICDPLIPVRGHGLISLCRLLEKKDIETLENQKVVLKIFEENLSHPDTYLYLTSARGLALLSDKFPDKIIPKLSSEFANYNKGEKSIELRMKIGECLLQTTRKLGDMAPKYRDILLPALLNGTRDKDPLVRASSLSNLGEICKVFRFSIGNAINEIFTCCQSLLKTDNSPEVRKAAALLTTLLLQGLGQDVIKMLDSLLRDLYHLLKLTLKTEKDEEVKNHILLSLNELDTIMRGYLFPKQTLEKKIRVLDQT